MDHNLYALEKQVESKLKDARDHSARAARSSLRQRDGGSWPDVGRSHDAGGWRASRLSPGV
jgi:hypothetical protein